MSGRGCLVHPLLEGQLQPWAPPGCRSRTWRCHGSGRSCAAYRGFCGMCRSVKSWQRSGVLVRMTVMAFPPLGGLLNPCCSRSALHSQLCLPW